MSETSTGQPEVPSSNAGASPGDGESKRVLSPEAERALAEAEERRRVADQNGTQAGNATPREVGGRKGPDPTRYGDWEKGGIVSDF